MNSCYSKKNYRRRLCPAEVRNQDKKIKGHYKYQEEEEFKHYTSSTENTGPCRALERHSCQPQQHLHQPDCHARPSQKALRSEILSWDHKLYRYLPSTGHMQPNRFPLTTAFLNPSDGAVRQPFLGGKEGFLHSSIVFWTLWLDLGTGN